LFFILKLNFLIERYVRFYKSQESTLSGIDTALISSSRRRDVGIIDGRRLKGSKVEWALLSW